MGGKLFFFLLCLSVAYSLKCRVCGNGDEDLGLCKSDSDSGSLETCPPSLDACWYGSRSKSLQLEVFFTFSTTLPNLANKGQTTYFRMCGAGTGNGCANETVDDVSLKLSID